MIGTFIFANAVAAMLPPERFSLEGLRVGMTPQQVEAVLPELGYSLVSEDINSCLEPESCSEYFRERRRGDSLQIFDCMDLIFSRSDNPVLLMARQRRFVGGLDGLPAARIVQDLQSRYGEPTSVRTRKDLSDDYFSYVDRLWLLTGSKADCWSYRSENWDFSFGWGQEDRPSFDHPEQCGSGAYNFLISRARGTVGEGTVDQSVTVIFDAEAMRRDNVAYAATAQANDEPPTRGQTTPCAHPGYRSV